MAKQADKAETTTTTAPSVDLDLVAKCIAAVTGCGLIPARQRAAKMNPTTAAAIAKLESENKRPEAVALIYS